MEFPVSGAVSDVDEQVCDYENSYVFVGAVHGVLLRSASPTDGLTSTDHEGHRRLIFRMTALIIGGVSALALLALPFIALLKGDATFATGFLDRHIPYLVALVMALLGGAVLKQILK